jgi:hypothetical protein
MNGTAGHALASIQPGLLDHTQKVTCECGWATTTIGDPHRRHQLHALHTTVQRLALDDTPNPRETIEIRSPLLCEET